MTYSELLAAIDLYALENPEHATDLKHYLSWVKPRGHLRFVPDHSLLAYIPAEAQSEPCADLGVQVNWTPDPP